LVALAACAVDDYARYFVIADISLCWLVLVFHWIVNLDLLCYIYTASRFLVLLFGIYCFEASTKQSFNQGFVEFGNLNLVLQFMFLELWATLLGLALVAVLYQQTALRDLMRCLTRSNSLDQVADSVNRAYSSWFIHQRFCTICNDEFDENATCLLSVIQCGHVFHAQCLDQLKMYSSNSKCPCCRQPI
jgi:hypothetical protein